MSSILGFLQFCYYLHDSVHLSIRFRIHNNKQYRGGTSFWCRCQGTSFHLGSLVQLQALILYSLIICFCEYLVSAEFVFSLELVNHYSCQCFVCTVDLLQVIQLIWTQRLKLLVEETTQNGEEKSYRKVQYLFKRSLVHHNHLLFSHNQGNLTQVHLKLIGWLKINLAESLLRTTQALLCRNSLQVLCGQRCKHTTSHTHIL